MNEPTAARRQVLQHIARGAAWMVAARWSMRGVGLVSTIILARLLLPSDFGLVAMGMLFMGFVKVFAEAGQELAVIRHPKPTAEHFDTAWSMSVCGGVIVALVLLAIAPLGGWYFDEPRAVAVICFLALAPLIEGFTNVGTVVSFRRDLEFDKEFRFLLVRKLAPFAVTIPLTLIWHNYWALVAGFVCGNVLSVMESYRVHSYRPRFRLTKFREIWSYSAWMQLTEIGNFLADRSDQIIVGGIAGPAQMGIYNVAEDLATAPIGEIVSPMARAVFPVYATILQAPGRLAQAYLSMLSITAIVATSTSVGVALVAADLVAVVLGAKWAEAAALVSWLAMGAGMFSIVPGVDAVLSVTGNARFVAMRTWMLVALLAPAVAAGGFAWGLEGVAAARMIVGILFVPLTFYWLMRVIPVTSTQIAACLWRPVLAAGTMSLVVWFSDTNGISPVLLRLFCNIGLGAAAFTAALLALWFLAGRPAGAEGIVITHAGKVARDLASGAAPVIRLIWRRAMGRSR